MGQDGVIGVIAGTKPRRVTEMDELRAAGTRWFCEVKLKAPAGFPADHFQPDPWFFPVDFTVRSTGVGPVPTLQRRPGEQGEVPDWTWLNQALGKNRYPDPLTVIRGST
ncbi:hypothetical protein D3C72_1148970 [compost metagenome]